MSTLQLYRGPKLRFVQQQVANFANDKKMNSVLLVADSTVLMRAHPSDFPQLYAWLVAEAAAVKRLMEAQPEDQTAAENLRGDQPG